jgi:hypothetical protein
VPVLTVYRTMSFLDLLYSKRVANWLRRLVRSVVCPRMTESNCYSLDINWLLSCYNLNINWLLSCHNLDINLLLSCHNLDINWLLSCHNQDINWLLSCHNLDILYCKLVAFLS